MRVDGEGITSAILVVFAASQLPDSQPLIQFSFCSIDAFSYASQSSLRLDAEYPLRDPHVSGFCPFTDSLAGLHLASPGWTAVEPSMVALMAAVAQQPVAVEMTIDPETISTIWQFYNGGEKGLSLAIKHSLRQVPLSSQIRP